MKLTVRIFVLTVLILSTFASGVEAKRQITKNFGPKSFSRHISKKEVLLIDVRTPEEFNEGHLKNAKLINFKSDDFKDNITKLSKEKTICVYCRSGNRSGKSMELLKQEGYLKIYNLKGGIKLWQEKGLEISKE